MIGSQDLPDLPPTINVVNEKLDVVLEKAELGVKDENVFEKQNLFSEAVSSVKFDMNEPHPSVATL